MGLIDSDDTERPFKAHVNQRKFFLRPLKVCATLVQDFLTFPSQSVFHGNNVLFRQRLIFICSEENVYLLIQRLADARVAAADFSDLFVIFVSNEGKQVRHLSSSAPITQSPSRCSVFYQLVSLSINVLFCIAYFWLLK